MSEYYTYVYSDPRTDIPFYVGKGCGDRANVHLSLSQCRNKQVKGRIRQLYSEGLAPSVEITHRDSEALALIHEQLLIGMYGRRDLEQGPLFNHTDGGECGMSGYIFTEEHRRNISAALKGKKKPPISDTHRLNMSVAHKGKPKPHSAAHIEAIRIAQNNPITNAKRSASLTGQTRSDAVRRDAGEAQRDDGR